MKKKVMKTSAMVRSLLFGGPVVVRKDQTDGRWADDLERREQRECDCIFVPPGEQSSVLS